MRLRDLAKMFVNGEINEHEFLKRVKAETSELTYHELAVVANALQIITKKSVMVLNRVARRGHYSAVVRVPKECVNKPCTVVVWPRETFEGKKSLYYNTYTKKHEGYD